MLVRPNPLQSPMIQVRTTIPMSQIVAVESVDRHAFSKDNVGQMVIKDSSGHVNILYFQAKVRYMCMQYSIEIVYVKLEQQ